MSRYTSTDFWRLYGQLVYIKSVEWLKKKSREGFNSFAPTCWPKKGVSLHVWTRKRPPPPFLRPDFCRIKWNLPFFLTRYKHHYSDTLQQISKGCMANSFNIKKTNLKTMFYFFSVTSSNCWRGTCTPDTWWGLWGWCGSRWRCSRGGSSYTDCSTSLTLAPVS